MSRWLLRRIERKCRNSAEGEPCLDQGSRSRSCCRRSRRAGRCRGARNRTGAVRRDHLADHRRPGRRDRRRRHGSLRPRVSNNGRYVVFWSYSPTIVPGDNNNTSDVFLYDATTGVTKLISRNAAGAPANGGSSLGVISANGKFIAFESSATDLDVGAPQGSVLVYRYNVATGRIKLASKSHTGGLPSSWSINANISSDGRYISYTSRAHDIVRGDHNN